MAFRVTREDLSVLRYALPQDKGLALDDHDLPSVIDATEQWLGYLYPEGKAVPSTSQTAILLERLRAYDAVPEVTEVT